MTAFALIALLLSVIAFCWAVGRAVFKSRAQRKQALNQQWFARQLRHEITSERYDRCGRAAIDRSA